jgi:hypothetical protein
VLILLCTGRLDAIQVVGLLMSKLEEKDLSQEKARCWYERALSRGMGVFDYRVAFFL